MLNIEARENDYTSYVAFSIDVIEDTDDSVRGWGSIFFYPDEASIWSVEVVKEYRRQGIGMTVMRRLLEEIVARGYDSCWLRASIDGQPLYEKLGFDYERPEDKGCYGAKMIWRASALPFPVRERIVWLLTCRPVSGTLRPLKGVLMHGHVRDFDCGDEDTQECRFCNCCYCTCCGCDCDRRSFYDSLRYAGYGGEDTDDYLMNLHDNDVRLFHRMYLDGRLPVPSQLVKDR